MSPPLPHVLVAEDNVLVADAMRLLFEETGHRVTTAGTIVDVVRAASSDPVDLLLLDLGLSDGDGLEILSQLAALDKMPRVSVALTGRDEPEVIERCKAAGCREVLLKPVPVAALLRKSQEWLGSSGVRESGSPGVRAT
ncbi:MAG TPA: response regulator [Gemmatimonadaceae bacterium]|nr:response regulator [Gemmatimonadaceae bacterium]